MLDSIMTGQDGRLFDKYYACLNENSMHTVDLHAEWTCDALKRYFSKEEIGTILKQMDTPSNVVNVPDCKYYFAKIISKTKARKIYKKTESHSESYTLRHSRAAYCVYYFSTPIYIRDYAIINWMEKGTYKWAYYKVLLLKRSGNAWMVIDAIDGGMTQNNIFP
jgi:hypothetical protein